MHLDNLIYEFTDVAKKHLTKKLNIYTKILTKVESSDSPIPDKLKSELSSIIPLTGYLYHHSKLIPEILAIVNCVSQILLEYHIESVVELTWML